MTDKPYSFMTSRNDVLRMSNKGGPTVVIFRASTEERAKAWLQVYLTLTLPNRRLLREACAR